MNNQYTLSLLCNDRDQLEACLSTWEEKEYPEARKERDKRLKELEKWIKVIEDETNNR